jgi:integrase
MSTQPAIDQYQLFNPCDDLLRLRAAKETLMNSAMAPNTLKAYQHSWKNFTRWCEQFGLESLPARATTVQDFITWAAKLRTPPYKYVTINLAVSAIRYFHTEAGLPVPIDDEVRKVVSGIAREQARRLGRARAGKENLPVKHLRKICRVMTGDDPITVRDRAVILFGFATALRRSTIATLQLHDVAFEDEGLRLWVGFEKQDQEGHGRSVAIPYGETEYTCPVRALSAWLKIRGDSRGPLFTRFTFWGQLTPLPLGGASICGIVKKALKRAGIDPRDYGAHSLRSGMITAAAQSGASIRDIMDRSGHKSVESVMRYWKSAKAFQSDPLSGVL